MMDRRERERTEMRALLLDQAMLIVETEGAHRITVRKVAAAVEYTAPVVYQHFGGKDGLLEAVAEAGYASLADMMRHALADKPAADIVTVLAATYLAFAETHPHLYRLMVGSAGVTIADSARARASTPVVALVTEALSRWAQPATPSADVIAEWSEIAWGVLHGMAGLGMLEGIGFARAHALTDATFDALVSRWREQS